MLMAKDIRNIFPRPSHYLILGGIFILLAGCFAFFVSSFFESSANARTQAALEATDAGIKKDTTYLIEQARELDDGRVFDRYMASGDITQLLSAVVAERDRRGIDGLLVTDHNGVVLTRSKAVQQRGDFIYHTTTWGRELAAGREVMTLEAGAAHPLDVLGAVPMVREGAHFGSIVAAYIVDDRYVSNFKDRYLPEGAEIAFLMPERSIVGNSFENEAYGRILSFYFNDATVLSDITETVRRVAFNGDEYFIKYAPIKGIDTSPGGVIVFIPASSSHEAAAVSVAAVLFCIGLFLIFMPHLFRGRRLVGSIVLFVGIMVIGASVYMYYEDRMREGTIKLTEPEFAIYNSTMELDPPVAALNQQFEHRIGVRLFSGGESINAVEVHLSFDPELAQVADIDFSRSFCSQDLIVERSIDNERGVVRIVCGLPTPGFSDWAGIVADIAVQPLREGVLTFTFEPNTRVFANDGLGTEVLRHAVSGSYVVAPEIMPQNGQLADRPLVFSLTHPNQVRWYNKRDVVFTWTKPNPDGAYLYLFNQTSSTTDFSSATPVTDNEITLEAPDDGVHYFHLARRDGEEIRHITHHRVMIDSVPPLAPQIRVSAMEPQVGELVRFEFSGEDALSGLQKNFYIQFNDGIFFPIGEEFSTAFFEPGEHTITVRSFDKANNFSDTTVAVSVRSRLTAALQHVAAVAGSI